MPEKRQLLPKLYFSYGQFFVYDRSVEAPGSLWTDGHIAQGFARRESTVSFRTLLDCGHADVSYCEAPFRHGDAYDRVIAVPFLATTGEVVVDGPDEINIRRAFELPAGNYRVVAAQRVLSGFDEAIDLFIEVLEEPLACSEIIVADAMLIQPIHFLESAEVA